MTSYKLVEDSVQHRFHQSRAPIQVFGGGFGNGKTAAICIKMISLAREYAGGNFLVARSTYPKLNDTVRKEFFKWCPASWVQNFTKTDNTVTLKNGSVINFRHIVQQGKNNESSTSNLLSATYDAIAIDQVEDPEITHKDFLDLMGRLRGSALYSGTDRSMPETGPRWLLMTLNPTRNWAYHKLVKPLYDLQQGLSNDDLICGENGQPLVELFEGSTYTNAHNLPKDFIRNLEATYRGQMRDRFLMGLWEAYEGLVYPQFSEAAHVVAHEDMAAYYVSLARTHRRPIIEGFDYGIAVPSCYLLGFVDPLGNVSIMDGFYEKELTIEQIARQIKTLRGRYNVPQDNVIYADPSLFNRVAHRSASLGTTISSMFFESGLMLTRGNNDVINGITKVQSYLHRQATHGNPYTGEAGGAYMYFSSKLGFVRDEFADYYWRKDTSNQVVDRPTDRNDHAMDALKYIMTSRPRIGTLIKPPQSAVPPYMLWHALPQAPAPHNAHRHR